MLAVRFAALICLLVLSSAGPGLFLARYLRWKPAETWCASVGLSLILVYLASFLIYACNLPYGLHWVITAACAGLTAASGSDLARLWRNRFVRRQWLCFLFLFVWGLLLLGLVRHYSGGNWFGDWMEHYERTCFFAFHQPYHTHFLLQAYALPARPPFMNLIAAHWLSQIGFDFGLYQVISLYLSILLVFPLSLLARTFATNGRFPLSILVLLLLASPMFWHNATWAWTKLLCTYYVVLGVALYLAGWRKRDPIRTAGAFLSLAAGLLVHYSAAPYALFIGLHYLVVVLPRRSSKWRDLALVGLPSVALLATWLGWSLAIYGPRATLATNTTVTDWHLAESVTWRTLGNLRDSLLPHPLHVAAAAFNEEFPQATMLGRLRDYFFLIYQTNYLFALGLIGACLVVGLIVRTYWRGGALHWPEGQFWLAFVLFCLLLGVVVHPEPNPYGLAHICGQPLVFMGVAFLAGRYYRLPWMAAWLGLAGCVLDFLLGVLLHFYMEHQIYQVQPDPNTNSLIATNPNLSGYAFRNWKTKIDAQYQFLGDYWPVADYAIFTLLTGGFLVVLLLTARQLRSAHNVQSVDGDLELVVPTVVVPKPSQRISGLL
jgi:hypothetical protein